MHVKREPIEDDRERMELSMDVATVQHSFNNNSSGSLIHGGPSAMRNGFPGYDRASFDPRLVSRFPQAAYSTGMADPQTTEELERQEKLQKELSNYMLQHSIPSTPALSAPQPMTVTSPDSERSVDPSSAVLNVLKMKRSNGKLAIPEILTTNVDLALNAHQRAKREFVPEEKKDEGYWTKRVKNNDSARRSRVKRKALEKIMEGRLMELQQENIELRHELNALKRRYGLPEDSGRGSLSSSSSPSPAGSYGYMKTSSSHSTPSRSSSPPDKSSLSGKEEELEHQSSASDDSRSLDDSRSSYNVRSASVLSQSLDASHRDRADSFSSCGSIGNGNASNNNTNIPHRSPNSGSPPYTLHFPRTDKSGALDLTNDLGSNSNRGGLADPNPSKDYHQQQQQQQQSHHHHHHPHQQPHHPYYDPRPHNSQNPSISISPNASGGDHTQTRPHSHSPPGNSPFGGVEGSMRGFPLKCRWKLSSAAPGSTATKPGGELNTHGSFTAV